MYYIGIIIQNYSVGSRTWEAALEAEIKVKTRLTVGILPIYFFRKSRFIRFSRSLLYCAAAGDEWRWKKWKNILSIVLYSGHAIIFHTRIIQYDTVFGLTKKRYIMIYCLPLIIVCVATCATSTRNAIYGPTSVYIAWSRPRADKKYWKITIQRRRLSDLNRKVSHKTLGKSIRGHTATFGRRTALVWSCRWTGSWWHIIICYYDVY